MKQFYVVAYDISNNRRRKKISDLLVNYGERANYSVFECYISAADLSKLEKAVLRIIDIKTDSVLFYRMCGECYPKRFVIGCVSTFSKSIRSF